MSTYSLNLTENYCDHWGMWEAVREILQNGEDQLTLNADNEISVVYNKEQQLLTISNKDSILNRKSLLFGGSTKKDDENTIGKFGEGYKIALLIFQKLGIDVVIKNYAKNEKWTTTFNSDSKYDGEKVLKVKIKKYMFKKLPDHNLSFEMKGITEENWKEIQSKYLREQEVKSVFKSKKNKNEILFDEQFQGKIFINGLFVEDLGSDKYENGYNFHPSCLKLDRDRQTVAGFTFQSALKVLLNEYASESKDNAKSVMNIITSDKNDISANESYYFYNDNLKEVAEEKLLSHGEYSYPVSTQAESDNVRAVCPEIKTVIVTTTEKTILSSFEKYKSIDSFLDANKELQKHKNNLTPKEELESFLLLHEDHMSYEALKALKRLISKSEDWQMIESEKQIDEEMEVEEEPCEIESEGSMEKTNIDIVLDRVFEEDPDIPF